MQPAASLVLLWRDPDLPAVSWYLRGISLDGDYYREVVTRWDKLRGADNAAGIVRWVEGRLAPQDAQRIFEIAAELRRIKWIEDSAPSYAALGEGPVSQPNILFRYTDNTKNTERAIQLLEVVRILRPYLSAVQS